MARVKNLSLGKFFPLLIQFSFCFALGNVVDAAEVIPPKPARYFNDYASKISPGVASQLNSTLEDFERKTSSQIVVAVFPKMQSDSSLEDYAQRIYQAWGIGQKGTNNGALLLIFLADRKMRIQTGYGLEGALPDAIGKRIIEDEIKPHFQKSDFDGGLIAGVNAILLATKGEYKGSGRTVAERGGARRNSSSLVFSLLFAFFVLMTLLRLVRRSGVVYGRRGRTYLGGFPMAGWGGSSGFSGGGGGGGFSGGGGSSGGGGASGSW